MGLKNNKHATVRISLEARIALVATLALTIVSLVASWLAQKIEPWWLAWLLGFIPAFVVLLYLLHKVLAPVSEMLRALKDGVSSFADSDFSVGIAVKRRDELGDLARAQNALGGILRRERQSLYQRELLLDTVMQSAPTALVLCDQKDRIVYSNHAARHLLAAGKAINGALFTDLLSSLPPVFAQAVSAERNGLFTHEADEQFTYHLAFSRFTLNTQVHKLYLFKHLTQELNRQEVSIWKKVIRIISHELNNSLAPISSLAHSGRKISEAPEREKLQHVFSTIEDRAQHLKRFIEGYAQFARLPAPQVEKVDLGNFLSSLVSLEDFTLCQQPPKVAVYFDPGQIQQVLINLLKNARESQSPEKEIQLEVALDGKSLLFKILDRGQGMSEAVLKNALLPFYSTKKSGTGLGLPLCREIVDAHGGYLKLANRKGGGLEVSFSLPESYSE